MNLMLDAKLAWYANSSQILIFLSIHIQSQSLIQGGGAREGGGAYTEPTQRAYPTLLGRRTIKKEADHVRILGNGSPLPDSHHSIIYKLNKWNQSQPIFHH